MCVAVIVRTQDGPTSLELAAMWHDNPHGAGIAWQGPNGVMRYRKGLMSLEALERALERAPRPVLLHFRWATHGPVTRALTHPFPLGRRAFTGKLNGIADAVLIHNGVWHDYQRWAPSFADKRETSDTAIAAFAAGEYGHDVLDDVAWSTAVAYIRDGRMHCDLRGNWVEHDGNLYSNLRWRSLLAPAPEPGPPTWRQELGWDDPDADDPDAADDKRELAACSPEWAEVELWLREWERSQ